MKSAPFWASIVLLGLTLTALRMRGDEDRVPSSVPLDQMPIAIGAWQGQDIPIDAETLAVLGKGVFLNREYRAPSAFSGQSVGPDDVGLFIGYFPTQRTGQSIHSPQNCLPGSGWSFESSGKLALSDGEGHRYQVGDYLISDGMHEAEVLYWYKNQGHVVANDYLAKVYTLVDSIRYRRTDAALIRVTTMLRSGETREQAQRRVVSFAQQVTPLLPAYIPN